MFLENGMVKYYVKNLRMTPKIPCLSQQKRKKEIKKIFLIQEKAGNMKKTMVNIKWKKNELKISSNITINLSNYKYIKNWFKKRLSGWVKKNQLCTAYNRHIKQPYGNVFLKKE